MRGLERSGSYRGRPEVQFSQRIRAKQLVIFPHFSEALLIATG